LKRHEKQSDQGSLDRQQEIAEVKQTIAELEAAHETHEEEAACEVQHHRRCVADAAQRYRHLSVLFHELFTINETVTERPVNVDDDKLEALVRAASHDWFDVSSDFQQDKSVPVWNESPQPGPTYFMSGHTHYVHIFCAESCGSANGRPRFSRINVYTRSEIVGEAKPSDDTISMLCDLLLERTNFLIQIIPRLDNEPGVPLQQGRLQLQAVLWWHPCLNAVPVLERARQLSVVRGTKKQVGERIFLLDLHPSHLL